jgi:transposase
VAASMWQLRDELWGVVERLVAVHERDPCGGRPCVGDRVCCGATVFVLFTGIAWRHLPRGLGCSPATADRRPKEWQAAGVFAALRARPPQRRHSVAGARRRRRGAGRSGDRAGAANGSSPTAARTMTSTAASSAGAASRRGSPAVAPSTARASLAGAGSSSGACLAAQFCAVRCTRDERDDRLQLAFMLLGCAVVCQRRLRPA